MDNLELIIKGCSSLKLLYVEDNNITRESTLEFLEDFFSDIVVAVDGEDGYEKFKENNGNFDIILTDINMPKLNGLDMAEKIREEDKDIVILLLSAHNETDYFMKSIKLHIDGYILKPLDITQFLEVLSKAISKISLEKELKENFNLLEQYQIIVDKSSSISKTSLDGIITYVNDEFCKISGFSKSEVIGNCHKIVRHPDEPKSLYSELWNTIKNKKQIWKGIIRNKSRFNKSYYIDSTITPILDVNGNIKEFIAISHDITEVMNPKRQLQNLVDTAKEPLVVMMNIENFENIENFYGYDILEDLEKQIHNTIYKFIPKACKFDKLYILGDGRYALASDKKECPITTEEIINNLKIFQERLNETSIIIKEIEYDISILMSVSYGDDVLSNVKFGLKKIEVLNQKFILSNGISKNNYEKSKNNINTLKIIKKAIEDLRIVSYFQPIINNKTLKVDKYESLVRLICEDGKILTPYFFLDIAKEGHYYLDITLIVIENSFKALKLLNTDISINISALDIEKDYIRKRIYDLLEEYEEESSRVVFELLEDENINNMDIIKTFINKVKNMGVRIAIDDFGAGYSNFERLLDYQPDILKIDGCLIRDIVTNDYSLSVVKTIVSFAKSQNLELVAEFIENEEIFRILKDLGVEYSQGYYFGKPEPIHS